jgi:SAM-dependent methyltransferase
MPDLKWNRETWGEFYKWPDQGEEWSEYWGGSEAQWFGSLYPRLHRALPARRILEIGPGFGRWTRFLLPLCQNYLGIDLSARCVSACQKIFSNATHALFIQNDGLSLKCAPPEHFDLVFSFDSLVHAELDVLSHYIPQILEKLAPPGVGFIHHSNFLSAGDIPLGPHYRATTVSADIVSKLITNHGGKVLIQEQVNWCGSTLHDCLTLFGNVVAHADAGSIYLKNARFMDEASLIKNFQSFYSRIK